jgi:cyanate permease
MMGVMMGYAALGGFIGPTLTGWVYDTFGNYQFVWLGFSNLLLLAIVLILKIGPRDSQS